MDSYITRSGVRIAVEQRYTDIYRNNARVIEVVSIASPRPRGNSEYCEITYRVVEREGTPVTSTQTKTIDAARLANPTFYALVKEACHVS